MLSPGRTAAPAGWGARWPRRGAGGGGGVKRRRCPPRGRGGAGGGGAPAGRRGSHARLAGPPGGPPPAMSIEVSCPACGAAYNLNDKLEGKRVRCKNCDDTFVVGNRSDDRPPAARGAIGTGPGPARSERRPARRDRDEDDPDDRDEPVRK